MKDKKTQEKKTLDRSEWPAWPPGKYQFYRGCLDPVKKDGTIWNPPKIEYEWEKAAKRSRAEADARRSEAGPATKRLKAGASATNATDREVKKVIEEMVSVIAEVSDAKHVAVGVWR